MTSTIAIHHSDTATPEATAAQTAIIARRKSTTKNPVPKDQAYRAVILPFTFDTTEAGRFAAIVRDALIAAAEDVLRTACVDDPTATSIDAARFDVAALLASMEAKAAAQKLNGEAIAAWYASSATKQEAMQRYSEGTDGAKTAKLGKVYGSLASNNPGINPDLAAKLLGYLAESDADLPLVQKLADRLAKLAATTSTADDL